ncbi:MAG: PEP-CTERM sorting domain-containing protein [Planctomycetota bacterium]
MLAFATLLLSAPIAQAVPITIEISGEVTFVGGYDAPDTIHEGSNFTGTYTYNSSTIDSGGGSYQHNSPYGFNISLGGYEFKTASSHIGQFVISIWDNHVNYSGYVFDEYLIKSYENSPLSNGVLVDEIRLILVDFTHTALSSSALPATAPVLNEWGTKSLQIYGPGNSLSIQGTITQAVPEPLTGILMVIGAVFFRRRRTTMKAQKLRGREGINSAKIFSMVVALFICLMLQPLKATVWTEGHHEIVDGDVYGEIDIYNDVTLDIFGGDIFRLAAFDTTITDWYDGVMDTLWARDNSVINIYEGILDNILWSSGNSVTNLYGGSLDKFASDQNGVLNLYAYDVIYHTTGGYWNGGWIEGKFLVNDLYFRFDIDNIDTFSNINIIPEPTTFLLFLLSILAMRKRN